MKKQYINPEMEVVELMACQTLLAGSGPGLNSNPISDGFADSRIDDMDLMSDYNDILKALE